MANYNDSEFKRKLKRLVTNRAVIVTFVTLLAAVGVVVAFTVAANRAKRPVTGGSDTGAAESVTTKRDQGVIGRGEETRAVFNEGETLPASAGTTAPEQLSFVLPVSGRLTKNHDASIQVYSNTMGDYRIHLGVDIATEEQAAVCASADGKVEKIWDDPMMGTCIALSHDGDVVTVYKNLAPALADGITEGASVREGQTLGCVGDTAVAELADEPHLHYEMTVNGIAVDPLKYFSEEAVAALTARDADAAYESSAATAVGTETANGK